MFAVKLQLANITFPVLVYTAPPSTRDKLEDVTNLHFKNQLPVAEFATNVQFVNTADIADENTVTAPSSKDTNESVRNGLRENPHTCGICSESTVRKRCRASNDRNCAPIGCARVSKEYA